MQVLLLDDEQLELDQLEFLINKQFPTWRCRKALNGTIALAIAEQYISLNQVFQLALIDIKIPGNNGLYIANKLKEMMPQMDIIVISAFQKFEYAKQSIQLKVLDYLVKPVLEHELAEVLNKYVKNHPASNVQSNIIQQAITMIQQRYHEPLKLTQVAEELYVHPSHLSRLFSEETETTFTEFLLRYRIKMAQELLISKSYTMQKISDLCGFNSQHYFSASFKKITGLTPAQFRNKQKGD